MKLRSSLLSVVAVVALTFAKLGAGVTCWGALYQPKAPDSLKNI